jgi:anti-sigma regulatory factor (Ser/Thr protein kinase)
MTGDRTFPAVAPSVSAARSFVAESLAGSPLDLLDDVQLMVSELTTNVIRHALTSFRVAIHHSRKEILVEVTDYGGGIPTMRSVRPDAPDGRGLQIVDMLSTRWGVDGESDSGKTVWFTRDLAGPSEISKPQRNSAMSVAEVCPF